TDRVGGGGARRARGQFRLQKLLAEQFGVGHAEPRGSMVVDIGGGTTEVAVISLGGIVTAQSLRVGGDRLDTAITDFVRKEHSLLIGERTAEDIKVAIGSAWPVPGEDALEMRTFTVRGREKVAGLPKTVDLTAREVRAALDEPVEQIIAAVKTTLEECPPELSGDIMEHGIVLTGGGALLPGLDLRIASNTGIPVFVAETPLDSVALGCGKCVEDFDGLERVMSAA
ncbi:rod shape-determining protein, partial [Streptomyces sp. NPDC005904]|uniref:rod shape-determining protein n=1 Tax=Streptomyces sp. NPDC005904 TaxID=3154570 RepID=UPI0033CACFBF